MPCGKCKIFLALCRGCYGSASEGVPDTDVREVVAENVREKFSERNNVSLRGNNGNESNKGGKEGFPRRGHSMSKGGEKQHRGWLEGRVQPAQGSV